MVPQDPGARSLGRMARGACQREDPELFFPITPGGASLRQVSAAKAVCRGCAVRAACLSFGLETRQDGIWGGTTSEERGALRQGRQAPGRTAALVGSTSPGWRGSRG
jgi:WhiB family transcriptional regulator, redox-sensing transcriptional regulator